MKTHNEFDIWKQITRRTLNWYNVAMIIGAILFPINAFLFSREHPAFFIHLHSEHQIFIFDGIIKCATGLTMPICLIMLLLGYRQKRRSIKDEIKNIQDEMRRREEEILIQQKEIDGMIHDESELGRQINLGRHKKEDTAELEFTHETSTLNRHRAELDVQKKMQRIETLRLMLDYLQKRKPEEKKGLELNFSQGLYGRKSSHFFILDRQKNLSSQIVLDARVIPTTGETGSTNEVTGLQISNAGGMFVINFSYLCHFFSIINRIK